MRQKGIFSVLSGGQIVFSKCGRDKGKPFVILSVEDHQDGEYVLLADGSSRHIDRPKKKKSRHVQKTNVFVEQACMTDDGIRKVLSEYRRDGLLCEKGGL